MLLVDVLVTSKLSIRAGSNDEILATSDEESPT
jgi:hypothetical protein